MKISQAGYDLIKSFEGCKLTAYEDVVGVWTVGYGSTGGDVCKGLTITQDNAEQRLRDHIGKLEGAIDRMVTVPLTQGEFDALCSFAYNVGAGALQKSTLLKKLNASDYDGACLQFSRWNKADGIPFAGLTRRRAAEMKRFEETT